MCAWGSSKKCNIPNCWLNLCVLQIRYSDACFSAVTTETLIWAYVCVVIRHDALRFQAGCWFVIPVRTSRMLKKLPRNHGEVVSFILLHFTIGFDIWRLSYEAYLSRPFHFTVRNSLISFDLCSYDTSLDKPHGYLGNPQPSRQLWRHCRLS